MSDHDPKNIPILDDILNIDLSDDSKTSKKDEQDTNSQADKLELFSGESARAISEEFEPELGHIGDIEETPLILDILTEDKAEDAIESALIDYNTQDNAETSENRLSVNEQTGNSHAVHVQAGNTPADQPRTGEVKPPTSKPYIPEELPPVIPAPQVTVPATKTKTAASAVQPSLESLVNDIVKQLMPELTQQLRILVRQNLKDKLPDDILRQLTSSKNKP